MRGDRVQAHPLVTGSERAESSVTGLGAAAKKKKVRRVDEFQPHPRDHTKTRLPQRDETVDGEKRSESGVSIIIQAWRPEKRQSDHPKRV